MQEGSGEDSEVRLQATGDYEVGYGRPPIPTRFKKGQSGNRRGRPKGSKNIATYLDEILQERVSVREGGKIKRMSRVQAMLHNVTLKAMKGDHKALSSIIALARTSGLLDQVTKDNGGPYGALLVEIPADNSLEAVSERIRKNQDELQARVEKHVKY
jgi:hypothetical protein